MRGPRSKLKDGSNAVGVGTYGTIQSPVGGLIAVGNYCSIAPDVKAVTAGHRPEWVTTFPFAGFQVGGPPAANPGVGYGGVHVGNDVWIGYGALLMGGITIGDGAVVGAGAVVASDVAPYAIVIGNPARLLRYRFTPEVVERLLKLKWWDWPKEKVIAATSDLQQPDVEMFLNKWEGKE